MLNVSNDFITAIKASSRRTEALVIMDFGPELAYPFASVVASSTRSGYYAEQVCDGLFNYSESYFTGSYIPAIFNNPGVGWKGNTQADTNGDIAGGETLTITYSESISATNFIVVGMDSNYPVNFQIETYDGAWSTVVTVTNNTKRFYSCQVVERTFTKVRITITKISAVSDYAHVLEAGALLTMCFNKDDISILTVLEEAFSDNANRALGTLSSNTLDITLSNENGRFVPSNTASPFYGLMVPKLRVRPFVGVEVSADEFETVPLGTFWSEDWPISNAGALSFSFTAFDRMYEFNRIEMPQIPVLNGIDATPTVTLEQFIDIVNTEISESDITVDDYREVSLRYAFSDKDTVLDFYQDVANTGPGLINVSRENAILIKDYALDSTPSVDTWSDDDIIVDATNPQTFNKSYSAIRILKYNLPVVDNKNLITIDSITIPTAGLQLSALPLNDIMVQLHSIKVIGATNADLASMYYGCKDIDLEFSNGVEDEIVKVKVNGVTLDMYNKDVLEYEDSDWVGIYERIMEIDSIYIQTEAEADTLAANILAITGDPTSEIHLVSRLNPAVEIGDCVTIDDESEYLSSVQIKVLRQVINWDGSLYGTVYGRRTS